jgi:nicotinamide-nucleotide amidase
MPDTDPHRSPATADSPYPAEIVSIGTELLLGRIQDTNSFWLAQQIADLGGTVSRITIIDDDQPTIVATLRDAVSRGARTIVTTGGLGPTPDDLTVAAVAELLEVETVLDRPTIEDYLRRRAIRAEELTPALRAMATVPAGARVSPSPAGWAPLIRADVDDCALFLLPGPPQEVQAIFARFLADHFGGDRGGRSAAHRVYVDMWESEVAPVLQRVMEAVPDTYCKGYIALGNQRFLPIDVVARGQDDAAARASLERALAMLAELVAEAGRDFQR